MKKSELKEALLNATGCDIQHTGWPCGTCFFYISKDLTNKDWQTLLWFRGDYKEEDLDNLPKTQIERNEILEKIYKIAKEY